MNEPPENVSRKQATAGPLGSFRRWASNSPLLLAAAVALTVGSVLILAAVLRLDPERPGRPPQPAGSALPKLFSIPSFTLTNQDGQMVLLSDLRGHVWVADLIFTRCAGPCPKMTQRLEEIQSSLPPDAPVRFVTLTADPRYDTPEILQAYARRFGAEQDRWWFLTGDPHVLTQLATDGFKFAAADKDADDQASPVDLYVHSTCFILVDQQGVARAVFQYTDPDMKERLLSAIRLLLAER
jgi:protein SCO1